MQPELNPEDPILKPSFLTASLWPTTVQTLLGTDLYLNVRHFEMNSPLTDWCHPRLAGRLASSST